MRLKWKVERQVSLWFSHARTPRRCCGSAGGLRALTASIAVVAMVVLVALGQPLLLAAGAVFAVLALVLGAPARGLPGGGSVGRVIA